MRSSVTPWFAALGVAAMTLTLSGCFGGPSLPGIGGGQDPADDPQVDEMVEDIVEGSGEGIDYESGQLPADFPVDDVPLVSGDILAAISISDGKAWSVTMRVADQATAESAAGLLEAVGYVSDGFTWQNDDYLVLVVTQESDDGGWAVQYQVQVQS